MEHVFAVSVTSNAVSEVNRPLLLHFVIAIERTDFRAHFDSGRVHVMQSLKCIISSNAVLANKIAGVMRAKVSERL